MRQNLLDHHIDRPKLFLQPLAICARVEQTIDVIDPESLHVTAPDQLADQPVRPFEYLR